MGRITVFTGEDYNSKVVLRALRDRQLPFVEISLQAHPHRLSDLRALCGRTSVPRVFFNTRHVGGVDAFFKEIRAWDRHPRYATARAAYDAELAPQMDPRNPKLQPSAGQTALEGNQEEKEPLFSSMAKLQMPLDIALPDQTKTTYHDMTQKLRNSLPLEPEVRIKGAIYKNVFTGTAFVTAVTDASLTATRSEACAFGTSLLRVGLIQAIPPRPAKNQHNNNKNTGSGGALVQQWEDSATTYYRLTADADPSVLNSYREWPNNSNNKSFDVWAYCQMLEQLLSKIEVDSARADGILDCGLARNHTNFPLLEEAVCRLQRADVASLYSNDNPEEEEDEKTLLFFALSLYGFWLRFAFLKVGVPVSDDDRQHFLNHVQFRVFGQSFTFSDWIDGVLRGNSKSPLKKKVPFGTTDERQRMMAVRPRSTAGSGGGATAAAGRTGSSTASIPDYSEVEESSSSEFDPRIHFALNVGPQVGSRSSPPFQWFAKDQLRRSSSSNKRKNNSFSDELLASAASVFWEDDSYNVRIKSKPGEVTLPQWIGWYKNDFPKKSKNPGAAECVATQFHDSFSIHQRTHLQRLGPNPKVSFFATNWAKNLCNFQRYDQERLVAEIKGLKGLLLMRRRFKKPVIPKNDDQRVRALDALNVLNSLPEERFDRVTRMMQQEFGAPLSMINFVSKDSQFTKSAQADIEGVPNVIPREVAICSHTINEQDGFLVIPDLLQDDRFAESPAATDFGLRFYAGVPMTVPSADGQEEFNVGAVCVLDFKPRDFTEQDKQKLERYAAQVSANWTSANNNNSNSSNSSRPTTATATPTTEAPLQPAPLVATTTP